MGSVRDPGRHMCQGQGLGALFGGPKVCHSRPKDAKKAPPRKDHKDGSASLL